MYMKILKYFDWISEELVTGKENKPFNIDELTFNVFVTVFNGDKLKLKEFIQSKFPLKNLKFIAGGGYGLAFEWDNKVIKFSTDENEANGVKKMLELGKIPGFAKYFWIKEIELPKSMWKKNYHSQKDQLLKELEIIRQNKSNEKNQDKIENLEQEEKEKIKKYKELQSTGLPKKNEWGDEHSQQPKMKKCFIICLEKLKMLDEKDKEIAHFIFQLMANPPEAKQKYLIPVSDNRFKLESLIKWIKSDEEEYRETEFVEKGLHDVCIFSTFHKGLTKKSYFSDDEKTVAKYKKLWTEISNEHFIDFATKMINIYKKGNELGIPTSDIHENNLGYSGNELVTFDCM